MKCQALALRSDRKRINKLPLVTKILYPCAKQYEDNKLGKGMEDMGEGEEHRNQVLTPCQLCIDSATRTKRGRRGQEQ